MDYLSFSDGRNGDSGRGETVCLTGSTMTCFGENAIALILKNQPCANLLHRIKE
jgi:hypothetical protein